MKARHSGMKLVILAKPESQYLSLPLTLPVLVRHSGEARISVFVFAVDVACFSSSFWRSQNLSICLCRCLFSR
jgi:hypothetical protein